jgi:hypothetical protein
MAVLERALRPLREAYERSVAEADECAGRAIDRWNREES